MSAIKDIAQLGRLVAQQHGWAAAKAFKTYEMSDADRAVLSKCALDLLKIFPPLPGACALMSAAFAVSLERHLQAPIQVVAGTLCVDGEPVFGERQPFDGPEVFGASDPLWHGHAWVMIGPYVADISLFRSAYSSDGPARLSKHVDLTFGPNKGLYVDHWKKSRQQGLTYEPEYVLSADEVTNLMGGAFRILEKNRPASPGE